jgi:hypothetical protein
MVGTVISRTVVTAAIGMAGMDGAAAAGAVAIMDTDGAHTGATTTAIAIIIIAGVGDTATDRWNCIAGPLRGRFFYWATEREPASDRRTYALAL